MNKITAKIDGTAAEFYALLREMRAISPIREKLVNLLVGMQKNLSVDAQKLLYIYFSLLDDGNTRMALDKELVPHERDNLIEMAITKEEYLLL